MAPARRVVVDTVVVALAVVVVALVALPPRVDSAWWWADLVGGAALAGALPWRRRFPVELAVVAMIANVALTTAGVATAVLVFTIAAHRPFRAALGIAAASVASTGAQQLVRADAASVGGAVTIAAIGTVVVLSWGVAVQARRSLVASLVARAEQAEAEQAWRVRAARQAERTRIAREMHDVLAHRISLLGMHAGALEHRRSASHDEVAEAAGVIRSTARDALQDLRDLLGVLRAPDGGRIDGAAAVGAERPQPTFADLDALVDDVRAAGIDVRTDIAAIDPPPTVGRAVYRVVQESLTNAAKHAPGRPVTITVTGAPGDGVTLDARNPLPGRAATSLALPGAGAGLIGIAERVELAGGRVEHGGPDGREFRLTVWLPWPR